MKSKIENIQLTTDNKAFVDGSLEIDDETMQISAIKLKRTILGKKEEVVLQMPYTAKEFPQFNGSTLLLKKVSAVVDSDADRKTITEILTRPLLELERLTNEAVTKAEDAIKRMLLSRADALDVLVQLRKDPRKELFYNYPDVLANSSNPIDETVERQRNSVSTALSAFNTDLSTINPLQMSRDTLRQIQKFAVAVGAFQDAVFKGGEFELRTSSEIVKSIGLSEPVIEGLSIRRITEQMINDYIQINHQNAVSSQLGLLFCNSCQRYFPINETRTCPNCSGTK